MSDIDQRYKIVLGARLSRLLIVLLGIFLILALRLFYLQVIRSDYYSRLALSNRIQRERVIAPRGFIRDRHGSKLVVNVPVYQISVLPAKVQGREDRLRIACQWLNIDEERLMQALAGWLKRYPDGREMAAVQAADKKQISVLLENRDLFPFFKLEMKPRRQYPEGSLAVHMLGYVGEVTDDDLKNSEDLHPGDIMGRTGIEYSYEEFLKGRDGIRVVEISAEGIRIGEVEGLHGEDEEYERVRSRPPVPGNDVHLTIDLDLQRAVERIFEWKRGSIVIMDPNNGEILAAVSRPGYDPNIFLVGVSETDWRDLNADPAKPLFNRIVQATYPPGSIFKLVTAYAGLREGVVTRHRLLEPCFGSYRFGNRNFRCWKPEGHGALSLRGAIVQSCDVYFYQVGEMLTADQFASAGRLFGIGARTGIDLPSEATGIVPDHAYFDRRFGKRKWTKGHLLNYSIGQGELLVTPVQLCASTAVFANGGYSIEPHVVMKIVDADGMIVYNHENRRWPVEGLDRGALSLIRSAMEGVVSGKHGTGRAAALRGFRIAGKTGTAQNPHGEDHALFVAYAPVDEPEVVMAIVMENAGHGGAMAAPLAREILAEYFSMIAGIEGGYRYGVGGAGGGGGTER